MGTINVIKEIDSIDVDSLLKESVDQGFRFLPKLITQWKSGENAFSKSNELFVAYDVEGQVVGIGGINEEPYLHDPNYGRLRHIYVLNDFRRKNVGRTIVNSLVDFARLHYTFVTLRTPDLNASLFYSSLGFVPCHDLDTVSHILKL